MKKQPKKQPVASISKAQSPSVFEKLVRHADTYDKAWAFVRKTFPRKEWGKVRDVVQACSKFKTLRAAFNALHAKGGKKSSAKSEMKRAA